MKNVVKDFYRSRSSVNAESIRWTGQQMLSFDADVIQHRLPPHERRTWVDVGCGSGDLQKRLYRLYQFVIGIDAEPQMKRFWQTDSCSAFIASEIADLDLGVQADLATAFGVVTCIEESDEFRLLEMMREWSPLAVLKHQVSLHTEKIVSGYSSELKCEYWARYPNLTRQFKLLASFWNTIEVIPYPKILNKHADTVHAAFVCSAL